MGKSDRLGDERNKHHILVNMNCMSLEKSKNDWLVDRIVYRWKIGFFIESISKMTIDQLLRERRIRFEYRSYWNRMCEIRENRLNMSLVSLEISKNDRLFGWGWFLGIMEVRFLIK